MLRMNANTKGMRRLSLMRGVENNSTIVTTITAIKLTQVDAEDNENTIIIDNIKNAADPSNDFENKFVLPNLIPIIAAAESAMLNTSKLIIAIFSLKIDIVMAEPIMTHEAPDNIRCSMGRVNIVNNLLYMWCRNLLCILP